MNQEVQVTNKHSIIKIFFAIFFFIVIVNTVFLDMVFLKNGNYPVSGNNLIDKPVKSVQNVSQVNSCPDSCLSKINEATSSIKLTNNQLPTIVTQTVQQKAPGSHFM